LAQRKKGGQTKMKCSKCGFISFDYLGECKRCGANLASTSDGLGLVSARKSMPFMLGSLLKDYVKPAEGEENSLMAGGTLPAIDLTEIEEPPVPRAPAAAEDDLNLDFSKEEIELLIEHEEAPTPAPAPAKKPEPAAAAAQTSELDAMEELTLDFDDNVLEEPKPAAPAAAQPSAAAAKPASEELELDLSESDLADLLSDLDEPGDKKKPNGSGKR
jgi:hypothetical protein